jgi:hypothetical protein
MASGPHPLRAIALPKTAAALARRERIGLGVAQPCAGPATPSDVVGAAGGFAARVL